MPGTMRLTWRGPQVTAQTHEAALVGLRMAGEHLLGMSRREVPIEEGTLDRSGRVEVDAATPAVAVSYDTPYARVQHENTSYRHDAGRKAKYLEDPLNREGQTMLALVAAQIRRALR